MALYPVSIARFCTTHEIAQSNIHLHRSQRGKPGSKEYIYNQDKITKANITSRLDYINVDALANPTKFNSTLAVNMSTYTSSITQIVTHVKQYDLLLHIMVPAEIDHINTTVSDEKYNLLTDHARFSLDHIAFWTVFFKSHPADPTDSVSDTNLLQDYLLNCITGRLKSEVHKKFC
jgi:hypothetical protein